MRETAPLTREELNPYATPAPLSSETAGGTATGLPLQAAPQDVQRVRGGFLYRELDFGVPLSGRLTYTGWWFVQRVYWNDRLLWRAVSWWSLQREIAFRWPPGSVAEGVTGRIAIGFGPGLRIRQFTVWCDGQRIYQEGNADR